MKHVVTAPALLVALALASCTSSTTTVADDPPADTAAAAPVGKSTAAGDQPPQGSPSATPLKDFAERLDKYISVRDKADDHTPPLKKTEDAAEIRAAQDALAQRIRDLLANAKHGDVFTPEISAYFRRLLRPELQDKGTKQSIEATTLETSLI